MTAEELAAAVLGFLSREADPCLRPDPYHLQELANRFRSAFMGSHLDPGFAARLRRALFDGLVRLDALPRTDPFWEGTNRRPTIGKLRDLAEQSFNEDRGEEWECWAYAAISLLWWDNYFGMAGWLRLHAMGLLDPAWPAQAAFHVRAESGYDTAPSLALFLTGIGAAVPDWARPHQIQCP